MRPSILLEGHRDAIRQTVAKNRGADPRVFGSVARGEDDSASDLDLLIDATPGLSLFDMARIALDVGRLVQTAVDGKTPEDPPLRFLHRVVAEAKPI